MLVAFLFSGDPLVFSPVLSGYTAVTDHPPVYFWKKLIQAYPEAKVGGR